jgi:putative restriction endonuclease
MRFWWVNHKQTARQEIGGGYLWSPKREANGARSQFYENMRLAEPGDRVASFSSGLIGHVGVVRDFASPALKPEGFGAAGENWSDDGWWLPVAWRRLPNPIRPKDRIAELGPLLPTKYSPINPTTGNGNQKAYLAEIGQSAFYLLIGFDPESIEDTLPAEDNDTALQALDDAVLQQLASDPALDTTTKQQLVLARQGQGLFRLRVSEIEKACRLTSINNPRLLIASHIKPWRVCKTAAERLDGANGLLLAPHVDRLFDRGLITFEQSGKIIVSPRLEPHDLDRLGLREACDRNCGTFNKEQAEYLNFHQSSVYLS